MRWMSWTIVGVIGLGCEAEESKSTQSDAEAVTTATQKTVEEPEVQRGPLSLQLEKVSVEKLLPLMPIPEGAELTQPHTVTQDGYAVEAEYLLKGTFEEATAVVTASLEAEWYPVRVERFDEGSGGSGLEKGRIFGAGYPERIGGSTIEMEDAGTAKVRLKVSVGHETE